MTEFLNNLTAAQATLIGSILSALIVLIAIFINRWIESKKSRRIKLDTIKKYANPIIFAAEQLAWRLKEILEFNGAYLLPDAPINGFFRYKFNSTVYRLSAVLGWIQAAKKEQSYLEGLNLKHHRKIQAAFSQFQKKLADGSHVEVSILDELTKLFQLKQTEMTDNEKVKIGVELEKVVFHYIPNNVKKNALNLSETEQLSMLREIMTYICDKTNQTHVSDEVIKEKRVSAITEISREFCWIYRDWQSAIGEAMLKEIQGATRRFDVIGFAEFHNLHESNEWLKKVNDLFSSLDVSIDDRFDNRVTQLKEIFSSTVELIDVLRRLISKQETIPEYSYNMLNEFRTKLFPDREIQHKKRLRIKISYA